MGLRTKLIAATLLFTFVLVGLLSAVFLLEVLRERVAQTEAANSVLLHQLLDSTRNALQTGLAQNSVGVGEAASFNDAVAATLRDNEELQSTLNGLVRYSPDMQDAFVTDAAGRVLVSSDPSTTGMTAPARRSFMAAQEASSGGVRHLIFGRPEVLDISLPLQRNGQPFLVAHLGLRSTFLREAYAPWLHTAALVSLLAMAGALLAAAVLSAVALRPIEVIEGKLAALSGQTNAGKTGAAGNDAMARVSSTISRLDEQMRSSEQTRSQMATNLNSMMYALKDAVMLFTADWRLVTASDAVSNFLPDARKPPADTPIEEIFPDGSILGGVLAVAVRQGAAAVDTAVTLEDGRNVQLTLSRKPGDGTGILLTLHDVAAEQEFGRELQLSQRLAGVGRLMTGVGHEVKNPINAMVVHLELLRGKLGSDAAAQPAMRHVDVLSSEMKRLDRVVQTLADFSRPIEPVMREQELLPVAEAVIALIADDAAAQHINVRLLFDPADANCMVRCDAELLRQALLNIALNAMQAMPEGGTLEVLLRRDRQWLELALRDTGHGIPPEAMQRIFDLYFTTKPSGSGIGLSMTYRIVQMHGGVLHVESESSPGAAERGSTFMVRLPLLVRAAKLVTA